MASDLTKQFDVSRQTPSGQSLEELRANYYISAQMNGIDDASIGGLQVNTAGRKSAAALLERKQQQATNDLLLLTELQRQFDAMSANMVSKYGVDFAEQFAAELLEPDIFAELMKIEDPIERQQAMAQAILDGIADGTIDPADAYANPDFAVWLRKYDELQEAENNNRITASHNEQIALHDNPEIESSANTAELNKYDFS